MKIYLMGSTRTGIRLKGVELILGRYYRLSSSLWSKNGKKWNRKYKLIQVTRFGFNLLDEEINKCVLKRHLYVPLKLRAEYLNDIKLLVTIDTMYIEEAI